MSQFMRNPGAVIITGGGESYYSTEVLPEDRPGDSEKVTFLMALKVQKNPYTMVILENCLGISTDESGVVLVEVKQDGPAVSQILPSPLPSEQWAVFGLSLDIQNQVFKWMIWDGATHSVGDLSSAIAGKILLSLAGTYKYAAGTGEVLQVALFVDSALDFADQNVLDAIATTGTVPDWRNISGTTACHSGDTVGFPLNMVSPSIYGAVYPQGDTNNFRDTGSPFAG